MEIGSNGNGRRRDAGHGHGRRQGVDAPPEGHSGRRFLIVAGLVLLALWGGLFLAFRDWRARYRERAEFGKARVVKAINEYYYLNDKRSGILDLAWDDAIKRTRAMLETIVASNLLDMHQMRALQAEVEAGVSRAKEHPETSPAELAAVWDRMADRAEFLLTEKDRHPRPKVLPARKVQKR